MIGRTAATEDWEQEGVLLHRTGQALGKKVEFNPKASLWPIIHSTETCSLALMGLNIFLISIFELYIMGFIMIFHICM